VSEHHPASLPATPTLADGPCSLGHRSPEAFQADQFDTDARRARGTVVLARASLIRIRDIDQLVALAGPAGSGLWARINHVIRIQRRTEDWPTHHFHPESTPARLTERRLMVQDGGPKNSRLWKVQRPAAQPARITPHRNKHRPYSPHPRGDTPNSTSPGRDRQTVNSAALLARWPAASLDRATATRSAARTRAWPGNRRPRELGVRGRADRVRWRHVARQSAEALPGPGRK
jgi:hypothetical protein